MSKYRIEICDSRRRKGEFFVRYIGGTNKLATTETLTSTANVNKNILAMSRLFGIDDPLDCLIDVYTTVDRAKNGYWARKFGAKHSPGRK